MKCVGRCASQGQRQRQAARTCRGVCPSGRVSKKAHVESTAALGRVVKPAATLTPSDSSSELAQAQMADLRRSPLHDVHVSLGARMVPFAGWEMPVQYVGINPESRIVRETLGIFDISHMGQLLVRSEEQGAAKEWLETVLTNRVASLEIGQGQYTLLLNENGGVIDDLIVYRQNQNDFFLVVNASRIVEDFDWMKARLPVDGVTLHNESDRYAGLAVQGPQTVDAFAKVFGNNASLPERFCLGQLSTQKGTVLICRTGYTGEDGFEVFCEIEHGVHWWNSFVEAGASPTGLGARDSLRLEKCYALNGNDLSPKLTPLQAGLSFAIDLTKGPFVGRDALIAQKEAGLPSRLVALRQTDKSPPPRAGYLVYAGERQVGTLSSGGVSPTLGCGVSMAYIDSGHNKIGTPLDVEIRGKRYPAVVVKKPFL